MEIPSGVSTAPAISVSSAKADQGKFERRYVETFLQSLAVESDLSLVH